MSFNKDVADTFRSIKQDYVNSRSEGGSRAGSDKAVAEQVEHVLDKTIAQHDDAAGKPNYIYKP